MHPWAPALSGRAGSAEPSRRMFFWPRAPVCPFTWAALSLGALLDVQAGEKQQHSKLVVSHRRCTRLEVETPITRQKTQIY